jgi:hypothetical protein
MPGALAQEVDLNMPIDPDSHTIVYQEVVEEDGSREELFNRGSTWLRIFYANPMAVSKVRDLANGEIRGQHQFRVYTTDEEGNKVDSDMILYTFQIEFKEDRYRYTVYDFLVKRVSRYPLENWMNEADPEYSVQWKDYLKQVDTFVREEWVPSLKTHMKPEVIKEEEEW